MKRTKTLLAFLAVLTLSTAAKAQSSYDFQYVTPQGDTLLCTIVDSAAHHVSVRGDAWSYNTHYIHYNADLVLPDSVETYGFLLQLFGQHQEDTSHPWLSPTPSPR